jgi:hypothetical protein
MMPGITSGDQEETNSVDVLALPIELQGFDQPPVSERTDFDGPGRSLLDRLSPATQQNDCRSLGLPDDRIAGVTRLQSGRQQRGKRPSADPEEQDQHQRDDEVRAPA